MRQMTDDQGQTWDVVAVDTVVAHRRQGATLGFRPEGQTDGETVLTPIEFNSPEAAAFAIRTMGEKELKRRLELAKTAAGVA
jgi:hypothetical protein